MKTASYDSLAVHLPPYQPRQEGVRAPGAQEPAWKATGTHRKVGRESPPSERTQTVDAAARAPTPASGALTWPRPGSGAARGRLVQHSEWGLAGQ